MNQLDYLWYYVSSCASGMLVRSDCGPLWQFGAIAALLCVAVAVLIMLRLRAPAKSNQQ